ncbi:MAG: hypothetical protein KKG92_11180 [Gammaproteobacteria bacterium]|nr:hypothetical protein [Gammaproteobacteria bacterium]
MTKPTEELSSPTIIRNWIGLSQEEIKRLDLFCENYGHRFIRFNWLMAGLAKLEQDDPTVNFPLLAKCMNRLIQAHKDGNIDGAEGWLHAISIGLKSATMFMPKALVKLRQEHDLRTNQPAGTKALKEKAEIRKALLHKAIKDYASNPEALVKGPAACLVYLKKFKATYDYADSYVLVHVKKIFAENRRQLRGEK